MNIFKKYCPNVFVAQCDEMQKKGNVITLITKYGKEIQCEIHNFLGNTREGKFLFSITRCDGTNNRTRAQSKAEKLSEYSSNAKKRSNQHFQNAQEGRDFLTLGEPIKVGHHSERRHRKLIERNWQRMGKSISEQDKAEEYKRRAEYWEAKANQINLSTPDSLEFFDFKLQEAKELHKTLKENPEKRRHSMSLQYANKAVKDLSEKFKTAILLWGSEDEVRNLQKERAEEQESKTRKNKSKNYLIEKYYGFFAFNSEQLKKGYDKLCDSGIINSTEKVTHIGQGLYIPSNKKDEFLKEWLKR